VPADVIAVGETFPGGVVTTCGVELALVATPEVGVEAPPVGGVAATELIVLTPVGTPPVGGVGCGAVDTGGSATVAVAVVGQVTALRQPAPVAAQKRTAEGLRHHSQDALPLQVGQVVNVEHSGQVVTLTPAPPGQRVALVRQEPADVA